MSRLPYVNLHLEQFAGGVLLNLVLTVCALVERGNQPDPALGTVIPWPSLTHLLRYPTNHTILALTETHIQDENCPYRILEFP